MKKCTILFAMMLAFVLPTIAQETELPVDENGFLIEDDIMIKYVPNRFKDNWELNLAGGVSVLFNGIGHFDPTTTPRVDKSGNKSFYEALGGMAEISATKWFNPYVAARVGWTTGYLPYEKAKENMTEQPLSVWDNYFHLDMLWDWTTQFGGYKPERIYDAVPYVHVGVVYNPLCNAAVGGGVGFLNRFHVANNWLINLDLRGTLTTARKYGVEKGMALEVNALVGVTYRFDQVGWTKKVDNPYKDAYAALRAAYDDLDRKYSSLADDNDQMAEAAAQHEQERKELARLVAALTNDSAFSGMPDTMQMTVYYAINSSVLMQQERAHMDTYIRIISMNDPNKNHKYKVVGTADAATGTPEINDRISRERAEVIKNALLENGIDPENITVETKIIESGDVRMSRASHVIIYPNERPKYTIPDSINLDD